MLAYQPLSAVPVEAFGGVSNSWKVDTRWKKEPGKE